MPGLDDVCSIARSRSQPRAQCHLDPAAGLPRVRRRTAARHRQERCPGGDGAHRNPFALQRLKDKLGNRSNASAEIELDGTWGVQVGEEGRGIRTILDMVAATRLDCMLGSSATMRQALVGAIHHTRHRHAFGSRLIDRPLMRNVLMDLALESEATTTLGLRLAAALDAAIIRAESALHGAAGSPDPVRGIAAQTGARAPVEQLATTLQACLITRHAPAYLAETFVASRLDQGHGHTFGTLPGDLVRVSSSLAIERAFDL